MDIHFMSSSSVHFFVHVLLLSRITSINVVTFPLQTHYSLQNLACSVKFKKHTHTHTETQVLIMARW